MIKLSCFILTEISHAVNSPTPGGKFTNDARRLLAWLLHKIKIYNLNTCAALLTDRRQQCLAAALRAAIAGDEELTRLNLTAAALATPDHLHFTAKMSRESALLYCEERRRGRRGRGAGGGGGGANKFQF